MSRPSSKLPNLTTDTAKFISHIEENTDQPLYKLTPQEARKVLLDLQSKTHEEIEADIQDMNIMTPSTGNVDVRIVRPKGNNEKLPVILYIHGGGWILGDKETHDMLIRKLAKETNTVVVFPQYSRSPEAQYPIAVNQVYATLQYIYEYPEVFNIDSDKIIIAGDSVGGNMATSTALRALKENGPKILLQTLFYPVTNADMDTGSYQDFKDGPWLTQKAMEWFWDAYLPDKKHRDDIYASPLKASLEDLKCMPPTLIITDENDVLRDEGEAYARKLDASGVRVLNVRVNGTVHDFMMLNGLSQTEPAKGAIKLTCSVINKILKNC